MTEFEDSTLAISKSYLGNYPEIIPSTSLHPFWIKNLSHLWQCTDVKNQSEAW
jgi:hypothetical protein